MRVARKRRGRKAGAHQAGKSQCTVPASCACAAFQDSAGLKGMCGAVWCTTVKVDIQKWYPARRGDSNIQIQGFGAPP